MHVELLFRLFCRPFVIRFVQTNDTFLFVCYLLNYFHDVLFWMALVRVGNAARSTVLAPSRKHVSRANGGTSRAARYVGEQCFDTGLWGFSNRGHGFWSLAASRYIRLSQKILSFYKEIIDARQFLFPIILSNYLWSILFYRNIKQEILFILIKRKELLGQSNRFEDV